MISNLTSATSPNAASSATAAHARPHVFVVDDESVIARTLTMILDQSGYRATPFHRAEDALAHARTESPDLVISDVIMPSMSGIELAIELQQLAPSIQILLFSGQAATEDLLQRARRDGHDFEILAKPVHPEELLTLIAKRLEPRPPDR